MNVLFRTDASIKIGTGHVMRCLTLAEKLRNHGANVTFICREHKGNLCGDIEEKGFTVFRLQPATADQNGNLSIHPHAHWLGASLEKDARETTEIIKKMGFRIDWLIVDHYALNRSWEKQFRPLVKKIMVIDDLADRHHDCDILLDQNLYDNMDSRYGNLVPKTCKIFLGPRYALLRPEFRQARKQLRRRDGTVQRIFVFFGGSDPTNETTKALEAIQSIKSSDIVVDVVVGSTNPHRKEVRQFCETMDNVYYHCNVNNMAELMAEADLAIGAAGATSWERCFLGLPSLIISIAYNQIEIAKAIEPTRAAIYLGYRKNVTVKDIIEALIELFNNPAAIKLISFKARALVDGLGVQRITTGLQNETYD